MKKPSFLATLVALAFTSACVSSQPTEKPESATFVSLPLPEGNVKIHYGERTVYLIGYDTDDGASPSYWLGSMFYVEFMGIKAKNNKLIVIDRKSYPISFWSSNSKALKFDKANTNNLGGCFDIFAAGKSSVVVAVQGQKVTIPMEVVKLPIHADMTPAAMIRAIGKPDNRISSPSEGRRIHRINGRIVEMAPESWTYKKYPGLRLIVDPISGLDGWRMDEWDKVEHEYFK